MFGHVLSRPRTSALVALLLGTLMAATVAAGSGALASSSTPVVTGLPLAASFQEPVFVSSYPRHTGMWAEVYGGPGNIVIPTVPAWTWSSRGWVPSSRANRTRVWVQRSGWAGWSWTWTQTTGWRLMSDRSLVVYWRPGAIAT